MGSSFRYNPCRFRQLRVGSVGTWTDLDVPGYSSATFPSVDYVYLKQWIEKVIGRGFRESKKDLDFV